MTATTLNHAQKNLSQLMENVKYGNTVIIVNDDGENAVLISEEEWNSIQETVYLYSIPGTVENLIEARKEPLSECKTYDPDEEW